MKITEDDELIDGGTGLPVIFECGLSLKNYRNKDDIENLRNRGFDWYIYQPPQDFDPLLHSLGEMVYDAPFCYKEINLLTAQEKEERRGQAVAGALIDLREVRRAALARLVPSAGVDNVYRLNLEAIELYSYGQGDNVLIVREYGNHTTASEYLLAMSAANGQTVEDFIDYVRGEVELSQTVGQQIEHRYLHAKRVLDSPLVRPSDGVEDYREYINQLFEP